MKKTILFVAACVVSMLATAQIFEIQSLQHISDASFEGVRLAGISPKGDYILLTSATTKGLQRYDLLSQKMTIISRAENAGFDVKISKTGNEIVFTENVYTPGQVTARKNICANISANTLSVVSKRVIAQESVILHNDEGIMYVEKNGKRILLAPFGTEDKIYIWTSLSPDQTKVCYYLGGEGCYVCNIDGSNNTFIGEDCRAAQWYDNHTIVAMQDYDDGHMITASAIVAYTLDGKYQVMTSPDMIAMEPFAANGKIVFSTIQGDIYMMTVK